MSHGFSQPRGRLEVISSSHGGANGGSGGCCAPGPRVSSAGVQACRTGPHVRTTRHGTELIGTGGPSFDLRLTGEEETQILLGFTS